MWVTPRCTLCPFKKRAIRICTFSSPREHSAPCFLQLHTFTIPDINKLHTGILMFKFINNLLPQVISSVFTSVQDTHSHSTIELNWKVDRAIPRFVEGCDSLCVYSCNRVTVSETKFGVQKKFVLHSCAWCSMLSKHLFYCGFSLIIVE